MQTITRHNRNVTLDIIRGFAVLGILLVNISFFSTSLQAIQFQVELWPETWNQVTQSVLDWLVQGKFIAIFSFLFGYGMILFKERMEEKGIPFPSLFLRRLFALLIFGLLHGMFIWYGDILVHYALLGFVLLLFHNRRPKTLMIWAVLSLLLIPLLSLLSSENSGSMPLSEEYQQQVEFIIELDTAIYGNGTFSEIQQLRMRDWISSFINQLVFYPQLLGLFLLGAYFAKRKILDPNSSSRLLWRITLGAGGAGLILTFLPLLCKPIIAESLAWEYRFIAFKQLLGAPLLGIGYLCLDRLALSKRNCQSRFAAVGQRRSHGVYQLPFTITDLYVDLL